MKSLIFFLLIIISCINSPSNDDSIVLHSFNVTKPKLEIYDFTKNEVIVIDTSQKYLKYMYYAKWDNDYMLWSEDSTWGDNEYLGEIIDTAVIYSNLKSISIYNIYFSNKLKPELNKTYIIKFALPGSYSWNYNKILITKLNQKEICFKTEEVDVIEY